MTTPAPKPRGRDALLGNYVAHLDELPPQPVMLAAVIGMGVRMPSYPITVRVRTCEAFRRWLGMSRAGDRAIYYEGTDGLAEARRHDKELHRLADQALQQSTVNNAPVRSACRHVRGILNGTGRVRLHMERAGDGVRMYAVRA